MASTIIDSLFKIMKIAGGLYSDKDISPETKKYVGQIYHYAYLSLAEEGLPSLFAETPQIIQPFENTHPVKDNIADKESDSTAEQIDTATEVKITDVKEDTPSASVSHEQELISRLESASSPHEMLSVLFQGEEEVTEREAPEGLVEGVDYIGVPPTDEMVHVLEDEEELPEGVTTNLQEINKTSQWNESSLDNIPDDSFDEFEEEYAPYEDEADEDGMEEDETEENVIEEPYRDENDEEIIYEDIDEDEFGGEAQSENEKENQEIESSPEDEASNDVYNDDALHSEDSNKEDTILAENDVKDTSIKELTNEWMKTSDPTTASILDRVQQIIDDTLIPENAPTEEPSEPEQKHSELSPMERAFIIPEGVEFPSAMKKNDFTFYYSQVSVTGPDDFYEDAEIIISPLSLKEGAKDIAVWVNCDRGVFTDASGPRKSVLIHLNKVDLIAKGIMTEGKFVPSIELTKREAEQGYVLEEDESVSGGDKGHVLLFDDDFYIHIFPISFPSKKKETEADYYYCVKKDGETETGETSSGTPYTFDLDGVTSVAAARWTADGVLIVGVMPKGI